MRLSIILIVIAITSFACSNNKRTKTVVAIPKDSMLVFDTVSETYQSSSTDTLLITSWDLFVNAAVNKDLATLKPMSADCMVDEASRIIPADEFYREHSFIFDSFFVSGMRNKENVRAVYREGEWVADSVCIPGSIRLARSRKVNIFVSFPLRKGEIEGSSGILEFLETKSGYKFCGYSSIP